jgi:hypothetical protein
LFVLLEQLIEQEIFIYEDGIYYRTGRTIVSGLGIPVKKIASFIEGRAFFIPEKMVYLQKGTRVKQGIN